MANLSGSQLVVVLIVTAALAYLGYVLSENDRRNLGRTPWGLPSAAWAVFWFISPLVGFVLYLFAHRAEVRRAGNLPLGPAAVPTPAEPVRASASDFPAYPRRADGGVSGGGSSNGGAPPTPQGGQPQAGPPHATAGGHPISPPAWHPDPSGRYHYRWWTGSEWTSYVSVHGHVEVDTSPDQRIGPY